MSLNQLFLRASPSARIGFSEALVELSSGTRRVSAFWKKKDINTTGIMSELDDSLFMNSRTYGSMSSFLRRSNSALLYPTIG